MLPRLETVLCALEDDRGQVQVWALPAKSFKTAMYDSRSSGAVGGRVKMVARAVVLRDGLPVARFSLAEVAAATGDTP